MSDDLYWESWSTPRPRRTCSCGSGVIPWWVRDYQGIELAKVCGECEDEMLSGFRPEILTGYSQADVDEPIESEDC